MSAKDDLPSKQKGFRLGIDDYMVKPLELDELLLRVKVLQRRANIEMDKKISVGNLILDADAMREVLVDMTVNYGCTVVVSSHILGELEKIATHYGIVRGGKMIKEMTAAELEAGCRTYVAVKVKDMRRAKMLLSGKYSRVEESEDGYLRVYDAKGSEEIVTYLYENSTLISEIRTDKIGLEEYYIDLMNEKETRQYGKEI